MEADSIPLKLYFLTFPSSEDFKKKYHEKLKELKTRDFQDQNYDVEDERSYKFFSKSKHHYFDEISIIETTRTQSKAYYAWKEFFVDDKQQLLEIMAISELRQELSNDKKLGLTPLHRYMYKKVPHGWIGSRYRIRVLLEWVDPKSIPLMTTNDKVTSTTELRDIFVSCLRILAHLHEKNIYICDLRPEYITYDKTNKDQPFRLMDRLIEGVDPIKRITQSKSRGWTSYCHPKIWDIYCKENEESYRKELLKKELISGMDVFSLAMIVLQLGTKRDFSLLYVFNGRFNQQLLTDSLEQFKQHRENEDPFLNETLNAILLQQNVNSIGSPESYLQKLEKNPPRNALATANEPNPQSPNTPPQIRPPTDMIAFPPSPRENSNRGNPQAQNGAVLAYDPILPKDPPKQESKEAIKSPDSFGNILDPANNNQDTQNLPPETRPHTTKDPPSTDPNPNPEEQQLISTHDRGNSNSMLQPMLSQTPDIKEPSPKILKVPNSTDAPNRSGCPCCTLI